MRHERLLVATLLALAIGVGTPGMALAQLDPEPGPGWAGTAPSRAPPTA